MCLRIHVIRNKGLKEEKLIESLPPVLSHSSRHIFISAERDTTEMRILSLIQSSSVSWMLPGSTVVKDPYMIRISLEECVGRCLLVVK